MIFEAVKALFTLSLSLSLSLSHSLSLPPPPLDEILWMHCATAVSVFAAYNSLLHSRLSQVSHMFQIPLKFDIATLYGIRSLDV